MLGPAAKEYRESLRSGRIGRKLKVGSEDSFIGSLSTAALDGDHVGGLAHHVYFETTLRRPTLPRNPLQMLIDDTLKDNLRHN